MTKLQGDKVNTLTTQNYDLKRRRVTNAGDAQESRDYVTLQQYQAGIKEAVQSAVVLTLAALAFTPSNNIGTASNLAAVTTGTAVGTDQALINGIISDLANIKNILNNYETMLDAISTILQLRGLTK